MRVGIVLKTTEGGLWIVPQIRALLARGAEVLVILPSGPGRLVSALTPWAATTPALQIRQVAFDFSYRHLVGTPRGLCALRRLVSRARLDVCLYHLYASALAARVVLVGSTTRGVHMVAGPLYLESGLIAGIERVLCRLDDRLVAGSDYTARAYRRLGMPADRVRSIAYGVDTDHFAPGPGEGARARWGLGADEFVVVMVSYVYGPKALAFAGRAIKGHAELLQAWEQFHRRHPGARLLLVGGGFDAAGEAERQRIIGRLNGGLAEQGVTWLDSLDDVRDAYRAADLSVSPSLSENHGAALEASAMGVPSIVTDAGGLPETVTPASGWTVPAGSAPALAAALTDAWAEWGSGALTRRGLAARERAVAAFDAAACADQLADVVLETAR